MGGSTTSYIDAEHVPSDSIAEIELFDPSTGMMRGTIGQGDAGTVDAAVSSARRAFEDTSWTDLPPADRKKLLQAWAALIEEHASELDAIDAFEMGKPVSIAAFNAAGAADFLRFQAEAIDKLSGEVLPTGQRCHAAMFHVPRGVVGAITPWNFPTYNAMLKIAPALAAGNAVVLKPSELSSSSALRVAELATDAGLPKGIFNVVLGAGVVAGRALAEHHDVDMLAFTGSTATGKAMLRYSGESNMKVVVAECGGKSPQIVFADCHDIEAVGSAIAASLLLNQGQVCSVGSRLLVENSIRPRIVEVIAERMRRISMGDARDPSTDYGPMASAAQRERVRAIIERGKTEAAKLVQFAGDPRVPGYFLDPALFDEVRPDSPLAQEEIFGPVLSVTGFDTIDEAIMLANSTAFGLAAYVWTKDVGRCHRMARAVRAGIVFCNAALPGPGGPGHALSIEPAGQSGIGVESGLAGLGSYLRRQLVVINH